MTRWILFIAFATTLVGTCAAHAADTSIENTALTVNISQKDATFSIQAKGLDSPVFTARVGAEVDHHWLWSTDYPKRSVIRSPFDDALGAGQKITATFSGRANSPDLIYTLNLYRDLPFGSVRVKLKNSTTEPFTVQDIRVIDVTGNPKVNLGGPEYEERVLSDSFSEDRPVMRIADLGKSRILAGTDSSSDKLPSGHFAVGSQLTYNRASGYSLFLGVLTADKWLTLYHLDTRDTPSGHATVSSYAVDCTGTTEVERNESLANAPAADRIELNLPLSPGGSLSSERVMFAAGRDYHAQLEAYGKAIRQLRHARIPKHDPWGWWSWTAHYSGLNQGIALTNAKWLAQNLKTYGYNYFHIDEGYAYANGEYATPNATQFPDGIRSLGYKVTSLGLRFGVWVGPFRVSARSWVFEHHPDWMVRNAAGAPISIGKHVDTNVPMYVLDTTNPGAQAYLRETYHTLVRKWGVRYIKLDFMDDTAIEGYHYQPNTTAVEAEQIGLKIIRDAVGPGVLLDKDGSPMLPAVGYVDLGRISVDTGHSFQATREVAPGIAARYYMNGNFYGADPDAFTVSKQVMPDRHWHQQQTPLTLNEAEVSITLAAVSGGMFEIGDDLPTLGSQPERLALVKNRKLLDMVRLGQAAFPEDLLTYSAADGQPSIFFLQEDKRQAMLAVFNWTDGPRSHSLRLSDFGWKASGPILGTDVFHPDRRVEVRSGTVHIENQAPRSVRLIQLVDASVPARAPMVKVVAPQKANIGQVIDLKAVADTDSSPALYYRWNFGDGTRGHGALVNHAYTTDGVYDLTLTAIGLDQKSAHSTAKITIGGTLDTRYTPDRKRFQEDSSH